MVAAEQPDDDLNVQVEARLGRRRDVMGGVLDSGGHSEFTVIGDAVNVAQRPQTVTKAFGASLVVSSDLLSRVPSASRHADWTYAASVKIPGRTVALDIAYLMEVHASDRAAAAL